MRSAVVRDNEEGAVINVHVQPKASRTEYVGLHGGALKFRVAATPVGGAANEELCRYLASRFGLAKSDVMVKAGQNGRHKRLVLRHVRAQRVCDVLDIPSSG